MREVSEDLSGRYLRVFEVTSRLRGPSVDLQSRMKELQTAIRCA
jgi:hypothetical protein